MATAKKKSSKKLTTKQMKKTKGGLKITTGSPGSNLSSTDRSM
ncbi:MAG: hypothetical protein ACLQDV_15735 [Candidatus Binataceae bacterium]